MDTIALDQQAEELLLEFDESNDLPLNGEFSRMGYKYKSSLRNVKSVMTKVVVALVLGGLTLIVSELVQNKDGKG